MRFVNCLIIFLMAFVFASEYSLSANIPQGRHTPLSKRELALSKQAKLSYEDARKAALAKVPGEVFNWELEKENGKLIYSIQMQLPKDKVFSREVNIDAMTGKVVSIEKENLKRQLERAKAPH